MRHAHHRDRFAGASNGSEDTARIARPRRKAAFRSVHQLGSRHQLRQMAAGLTAGKLRAPHVTTGPLAGDVPDGNHICVLADQSREFAVLDVDVLSDMAQPEPLEPRHAWRLTMNADHRTGCRPGRTDTSARGQPERAVALACGSRSATRPAGCRATSGCARRLRPLMRAAPRLLLHPGQMAEIPGRRRIAGVPSWRQQPLRRAPPQAVLHPRGLDGLASRSLR